MNVALHGALGKMGRRLAALIAESGDMRLTCAVEAAGAPGIGTPLKNMAPEAPDGLILTETYNGGADVVIDFSFHTAVPAIVASAAGHGTPIVIGTTALSAGEREAVEEASAKIPVLLAPNMSIGANVLFETAARMAAALGEDFDIEIIEAHHRFKKDAPSGTALEAARRIARARGLSEKDFIYGRQGDTGARPANEIAIHSVRAGDIVGDHTVVFSCLGERLELVHRAHTRDAFARGALRAARFVAAQPAGLYAMKDVLASK